MELKEKAKEIRKILKGAFPDIKFSVRMSGYSAVYINYFDGVPTEQVEELVNRFKSIDRDEFGEILAGGNDYIFVNREVSNENRDTVYEIIDRDFPDVKTDKRITDFERMMMYKNAVFTTDFRNPVTVKRNEGNLVHSLAGNTVK